MSPPPVSTSLAIVRCRPDRSSSIAPARASASAGPPAARRSARAATARRAASTARNRSRATSSTGRFAVVGDLDDVERRVQRVERDDARRQRLRHALARRSAVDRGVDRARVGGVEQLRQPRRQRLDARREQCAIVAAMSSVSRRERRNHVVPRSSSRLASISISDCTASSTLLSSASIDRHSGTKPKISRVSRYARTISSRLGAGRLHQAVDERAADAVDHAVGDVRRDDLALERMARHVRRVAVAQRLREIARQRGRDPRIVGQRRGQELVVEPDLAVGEQHGALGRGQPLAARAALGDLLVGRQEFDRAVEPSRSSRGTG